MLLLLAVVPNGLGVAYCFGLDGPTKAAGCLCRVTKTDYFTSSEWGKKF